MRAKPKPIRFFKRTRARIPVLLSLDRRDQKAPHLASILDLSFLGMRVRAKAELKPGQLVDVIRMTGACAGVPGQVVWVEGAAGDHPKGGLGPGSGASWLGRQRGCPLRH